MYLVEAFLACLAIGLLIKHGVYRPARRAWARPPPAMVKKGPLSAEDIASLRDDPGEPLGPPIFVAFALSVVLLGAVAW